MWGLFNYAWFVRPGFSLLIIILILDYINQYWYYHFCSSSFIHYRESVSQPALQEGMQQKTSRSLARKFSFTRQTKQFRINVVNKSTSWFQFLAWISLIIHGGVARPWMATPTTIKLIKQWYHCDFRTEPM